jgi:hypothetical protein
MRRSCTNCGAPDTWARARYCRDCWAMVAKTLLVITTPIAAAAGAVLGHAIGVRLLAWWLR